VSYATTLTKKGQVTIPVYIRKKLGVVPYQKVSFIEKDSNFYIAPHKNFMSLKGSIKSSIKYSDKLTDKAVLDYISSEYKKENDN